MEADHEGLILKAIRAACVAGSLADWARRRPDCAAGLNKAAASYSRQANAALDAAMTRLGFADPGLRAVER